MNLTSTARVCGAIFVLCCSGSAFAASDSLIRYRFFGTIEEGGQFSGTFAIDPLAPDHFDDFDGVARFDLVDGQFSLWGTNLFENGVTSGSGTGGLLLQSEPAMQQTIGFNMRSDDGLSGATAQLFFKPFTGDAETLVPLVQFSDGYFDGNGQSPITSFTIIRVPEPASAVLAAVAVSLVLLGTRARARRSRRVAGL